MRGRLEATKDGPRRSRFLRPAALVPLDNVFTSVANTAALVAASRALEPDRFGRFALTHALVAGSLLLLRASFATPVLRAGRGPDSGPLATSLLRSAAASGVAIGLALWVLSFAVLRLADLHDALWLCAVCPIGAMTEIFRADAIRRGHAARAVAVSGVWAITTVAVGGAAIAGVGDGARLATAAWLTGSALAFFVGLGAFPFVPGGGGARSIRREATGLGAEALFLVGRFQVFLLLLAAVVGPAVAGSVRFAFTLVGPANTLLGGWRRHLIAAPADVSPWGRRRLGPPVLGGSVLLAAVALAPERLLDAVQGNSTAASYLIAVALAVALTSVDVVVQAYLISGGRIRELVAARALEASLWWFVLLVIWATSAEIIGVAITAAAAASTLGWVATGLRTRTESRKTRTGATGTLEAQDGA